VGCVTTAVYSSYIAQNTAVPFGNFHHTFLKAVLMCTTLQGTQIKFKSLWKGESGGSQGSIISVVKRVHAG
jgi:hypothetical protein